MTDLDYVGETYYTIRNLSLYECQGWCREEPECSAASFSFAVNPNSSPPRQETVCLLQNGTQATNPSAKPLRALNQYYMVKMSVRSGKIQMHISNSYSRCNEIFIIRNSALMRIFSRKLMFYKGKLLNIRQPNSH